MSYDIYIVNENGETMHGRDPHALQGGTYALGGTDKAWLNITYNYAQHFVKVLGPEGIRSLYGMKAIDAIPLLIDAIEILGVTTDPDYWKPTEGNAGKALIDLKNLCLLFPTGTIQGD